MEKFEFKKYLPEGKYKVKPVTVNIKYPFSKNQNNFNPFALELSVGKKIIPVDISAFSPRIKENFQYVSALALFSYRAKKLPVAIIFSNEKNENFYFINTRLLK